MRPVGKAAKAVIDILAQGLDEVGDHRKIDKAGGAFMAVSVEVIAKQPRSWSRFLSVAHYYEQNGDLMADPEMVFLQGRDGDWFPVSFYQAPLPVRHAMTFKDDGSMRHFYPRAIREQAEFADQWMRNIKLQQGL